MIDRHEFYIDGSWSEPSSSARIDVMDPSTEAVCARISLAEKSDVDRAVGAARTAFATWSDSAPEERLALVERILAAYKQRSDEMAHLISLEMGAPIDFARASQVGAGTFHITNFIEAFKTFEFRRPAGPRSPQSVVAFRPVGVAALITPWNWPMNQITLKVIPALLAGCTMVLKPSELSPLSAILFAEIVDEAGVPAGVFNLLNGDGQTGGALLSGHPDVDMVSFTGSTRAGIAITKAAADTLKKVSLELGGKGANLVFADADEQAVERGVRHCFQNSGQSCNAPTRMLVESSVYDRAVEVARRIAEDTPVASAHEAGRHIGPVVSATQYQRVQSLIEAGVQEGARLVAGGLGRPAHLNNGYFVRPTVLADVIPGMRVEKEEIFGPVLSIIRFDTEAQALDIANNSAYGLQHYVQTGDAARLDRVATQLNAGMVAGNGVNLGPDAFFGGVKASGRAREGGHWGIEEFLDSKVLPAGSRG